MKLSSVTFEMSCLNKLETKLVCLQVAFLKMEAHPSRKQLCIYGPGVNVPVKVEHVLTTLPRLTNESQLSSSVRVLQSTLHV